MPFAVLSLECGHYWTMSQQHCYRSVTSSQELKTSDFERFTTSPYVSRCWRQDLNLHSLDGNQALNLARLPIPPLQLSPLTINLGPTKSKPRARLAPPQTTAGPRLQARRLPLALSASVA